MVQIFPFMTNIFLSVRDSQGNVLSVMTAKLWPAAFPPITALREGLSQPPSLGLTWHLRLGHILQKLRKVRQFGSFHDEG